MWGHKLMYEYSNTFILLCRQIRINGHDLFDLWANIFKLTAYQLDKAPMMMMMILLCLQTAAFSQVKCKQNLKTAHTDLINNTTLY